MATINVGTLEALLRLRDELSPQLKTATQSLGNVASAMGPVVKLTTAYAAVLATAAAVTVSAVNAWADAADQLEELTMQTGLSAEGLQEMAFAAKLSGSSVEDVASATNKMQKALIEGNTVFERLGLSAEKLKAQSMDETFREVAERIRELGPGAQQSTAAMEAFGRGGAALLPTINAGLGEAAKKARELGIVLSQEDVKAAAAFKDQTDTLALAWEGASNQFAAAVLSSGEIQAAVEKVIVVLGEFSQWVQDHREEIGEFFRQIGEAAKEGIDAAIFFVDQAKIAILGLLDLVNKIPASVAATIPGLKEFQEMAAEVLAAGNDPFAGSSAKGSASTPMTKPKFLSQDEIDKAKKAAAEAAREIEKLKDQLNALERNKAQETLRKINTEITAMVAQQLGVRDADSLWEGFLGTEGMAAKVKELTTSNREEIDLVGEAEKRAREKAIDWTASLEQVRNAFEVLGISSGSVIGRILGGMTAGLSAFQQFQKAQEAAAAASAAKAAGVKGAGLLQASAFVGQVAAGIQMAASAIQIGKAVIGLFKKSATQKIAEQVGRMMGTDISKELAKAIQDTAKKLDLNVSEAALLNLDKIMAESGKTAAEMSSQIFDLMSRVASGALPAKEGIEQIDKAFQQARTEATQTGDAMTVAMLKAAQASGQLTDSMKAFVSEQNKLMAGGAAKIAEGLGAMDLKGMGAFGSNAATFFASGFQQAIQEQGLIGALESLGPQAKALFDQMIAAGDTAGAKLLEPFAALQSKIGENPQIAGMLKTLEGIGDVFKGAANTGLMNPEMQAAFGDSMKQTLDAMKTAGVDGQAAMTAIMPQLKAAVEAAQQMGIPLDAKTAEMKAAAEAMGFSFPVEPMLQVVDLLKTMVQGMGFELPASAQKAATANQAAAASSSAAWAGSAQTMAGAVSNSFNQSKGSLDAFEMANELAAQAGSGAWVANFGELPIQLNQMIPDLTVGFNNLATAADPGLKAVRQKTGGILGDLRDMVNAAKEAGSAIGGMGSGGGPGGGGSGGGPGGGGGGVGQPQASGFFSPMLPSDRTFRLHRGERVEITPASQTAARNAADRMGGDTINNVFNTAGMSERQLLRLIKSAQKGNRYGTGTQTRRTSQGRR